MANTDNQSSRWRSWHYILLWLVALTSLALNVFMLVGLYNFRRAAQEEISRVSQILDGVEIENYDLPIVVDETLPISLTVPFNDTFQVPIKTTVPISTSVTIDENIAVPINDVVSLNRNAQIVISVLGQSIPVDVPIRADIPLSMQTDVPINLKVPVQTEIPIDLMIEVPVETEVPIEAEIPVQLDFPVTVPLDQMGFNVLLVQVRDGLRLLAELLGADGAGG